MRLTRYLTFGIRDRLEWLKTLSRYAGVGLWDAVIHDGDAAHPKSRWTWSAEFRRLIGFSSVADFPDLMTAWSDRLHPEDVDSTFAAFGETLQTGKPYDVYYRLKVRDGRYRWFQATGGVVKDRRGRVRRACGSLIDVHDARTQECEQREAVQTLVSLMRGLAGGDLRGAVPDDFPERFAELKIDFNAAMRNLRTALSTVFRISGRIEAGLTQIRQGADDLAQRTEQQAASLEETAAAMDAITATVQETATGAVRACMMVGETRGAAEHSGTVARKAVDAMAGIERTSAEISDIISVIDGIAFQTNLLALNAGVEVARAGDAGKGFAVVASEVRALAQRSADAAKDVKQRITASGAQVAAGVALVSEMGEALQRIVVRISDINSLVATIAASAEQQAKGLQQVNSAVGEMDGVTQQNAAMVVEATAATRGLADEAEALAQEVGQFRLGDERDPPALSAVHHLQERVARSGLRILNGGG